MDKVAAALLSACVSLLLLPVFASAADAASGPGLPAHLDSVAGEAGARMLLRRSGIGALPAEVARLAPMTRAAAIEQVIAGLQTEPHQPLPAWVHAQAPAYWARGDMQAQLQTEFDQARDAEVGGFRRWWVREMATTGSPQTEKLVLFWSSHFATPYAALAHQSTSVARQNQRLRELGSGNYRTLLKAMLRDAGLLHYLDNLSNRRTAPNENLAREFLELYTLGEGHFSENDVRNAARALTGWGVSPANSAFSLNQWQHDAGSKVLFGQQGQFGGDDLVDVVLQQPRAAIHLAGKFFRFYISETDLDPLAIESMASQFRQSDYDIRQLLRATFQQKAFWNSAGAIIKSPVDLLIGTLRTLDQPMTDWALLPAHLSAAGQSLLDPPNVAGWPGFTSWVTASRTLRRQQSLQQLVTGLASQQDAANPMSGMLPESRVAEPAMMRGAPDKLLDNGITVRLAAENFRGAPRFRVDLQHQGATVWASAEQKCAGRARYRTLWTRRQP